MNMVNINGMTLPSDVGPGGTCEPGTIMAANDSRFVQAHFQEPLTNYAVGWRDQEGLQDLLDFLAPPVTVPQRFEYIEFINQEAFLSDLTQDIRAIGSDFKRVELLQKKTTSRVYNKGLTMRIDLDQVDQNTNWREQIVSNLQLRLLRNEVRRAYVLLLAAGKNTGIAWSGITGMDPDQDIFLAARRFAYGDTGTATSGVGLFPSNVLWDTTAWAHRMKATRGLAVAGAFASAGLTPEQVATQFGYQRGKLCTHAYQVLPTGTADKALLSGGTATTGYVLCYLANPAQTVWDPSNIKRFISQTIGGTMVRVYEQQVSMKLIDISVECYSNIVITSTLGVQKLTIT